MLRRLTAVQISGQLRPLLHSGNHADTLVQPQTGADPLRWSISSMWPMGLTPLLFLPLLYHNRWGIASVFTKKSGKFFSRLVHVVGKTRGESKDCQNNRTSEHQGLGPVVLLVDVGEPIGHEDLALAHEMLHHRARPLLLAVPLRFASCRHLPISQILTSAAIPKQRAQHLCLAHAASKARNNGHGAGSHAGHINHLWPAPI